MPVGGGGAWPGFETTRRAKLAARTARGRAAAHRHTQRPGPSSQATRHPQHATPQATKTPEPEAVPGSGGGGWGILRTLLISQRYLYIAQFVFPYFSPIVLYSPFPRARTKRGTAASHVAFTTESEGCASSGRKGIDTARWREVA